MLSTGALRPAGRGARTTGIAVGVVIASMFSAIVMTGTAAADPPGCSATVSGSTRSDGLLQASGTGTCSSSRVLTFRVEIKQDIPGETDPLVGGNETNNQGVSSTRWSTSAAACDHGNTKIYYPRSFFRTNTTYHDGTHSTQHTCT